MEADTKAEIDTPTYQDLAAIEASTELVDLATIAFQDTISSPVYTRRAKITSKIQHFWPLVFEQAPQDVDQYIQPSDSAVFAACLTGLEVSRFECRNDIKDYASLQQAAQTNEYKLDAAAFGEPRSLSFRFEFAENEWFEDRVLEKKFWFRHARDTFNWKGRVSEPVRIKWKAGKDLSEGMTDAARDLWDAQEKAGRLDNAGGADGAKEDEKSKQLPEYKKLVDMVEKNTEGSQSFFSWFGFRGRWVSKEESDLAIKEAGERINNGISVEGGAKEEDDNKEDDDEDLVPSEGAAEVFMDGEELALALAEDVWPNAIRYFTEAQMEDGDEASLSSGSFDEAELEEMDVEDLDEADQNMEDIRTLTKGKGKRKSEEGPPAKKRKS